MRSTMRFVPVKSEAQLDDQILHRVRSRLVGERTALINQLRAVLLERGLVFPQGRRRFEVGLHSALETEQDDRRKVNGLYGSMNSRAG